MTKEFTPQCPLPQTDRQRITLAHGGGGRLTHDLIESVFLPLFQNVQLSARHDGAVLNLNDHRLAFTTDSFVVRPLFFPGGNIGDLAVNGTVNDLAMCGARPLAMSASFVLEEGFPLDTLRQISESMARAAAVAGTNIVTGDTKVVEKGKADGLYVTTSGIGLVESKNLIAPSEVRSGDAILINGDVGRHGMAVMAVRENLSFESAIESDTAPLNGLVMELLRAGLEIHCLRDLTRGGLATVLVEIAQTSDLHIHVKEAAIPVREDVASACEILGLDPLYVANEGRFAAFLPRSQAEQALAIMRRYCGESVLIGEVRQRPQRQVTIETRLGVNRLLDMLSGEQLPRIC